MSPLVKPSLMPVKTSPGSEVGSPFSSPALSYKMGVVDVKSPWHGTVQSPHVTRRGPKLWTSVSGRDSSTALEPQSHECSGLVSGELIVRMKGTTISFSEDAVFFFLADQQMNGSHHEPSPVLSTARTGSEAVQPRFIYTWLQNKQEQVE